MKKYSYIYRQQGAVRPVLVRDFKSKELDLCEGLYPPATVFEINHPKIKHLWLVWQMLRKIDLSACPCLTEIEVFGNTLLDNITLNITNPTADMNNIISRTIDLPGGIMNVTKATTIRKNYAEFEDRIKSLGYRINVN
ncbi:MAG: hypothetical protein LBF79_05560 [Dysgonamonadaceae bacterium]|jgi:hypothetical protein|nr:hypothetical protein [Dysgonamonadaceae bacterium]